MDKESESTRKNGSWLHIKWFWKTNTIQTNSEHVDIWLTQTTASLFARQAHYLHSWRRCWMSCEDLEQKHTMSVTYCNTLCNSAFTSLISEAE
jgi:hypothetical protein